MRKTSTVCRPDMTLDNERQKKIIVGGHFVLTGKEYRGGNKNKTAKLARTLQKITIILWWKLYQLLLDVLGDMLKTQEMVAKVIEGEWNVTRTVRTMQQTVLFEGYTIIREVSSGLDQSE